MSESTEYLIKNHKKTFEIFHAINNMEQEVFTKFDKALRKTYSEWLGDLWFCHEDETLYDDLCINIIHKDWCYKNEKNEIDSYINPYLFLGGDDPIWSFFGLTVGDNNSPTCIDVWLTNSFKQLDKYQDLIKEFDNKNQSLFGKCWFC